jgi:hypothetical protein
VIRCAECSYPVARLCRRIERGGVLLADALERTDGRESIQGEAIECVQAGHVGFIADVQGELWRVW